MTASFSRSDLGNFGSLRFFFRGKIRSWKFWFVKGSTLFCEIFWR
jgi:hypothetical protein